VGKHDRRFGVWRDRHFQSELPILLLPAGFDPTIEAFEGHIRFSEVSAGLGGDEHFPVPRRLLGEPTDDAIHPVPDCSVGIMVEGVHSRRLERAVGLDAVPSLPDCRGPIFTG